MSTVVNRARPGEHGGAGRGGAGLVPRAPLPTLEAGGLPRLRIQSESSLVDRRTP